MLGINLGKLINQMNPINSIVRYMPRERSNESLLDKPKILPTSINSPIPHCTREAPANIAILKLVDTLPDRDFGKLEITRLCASTNEAEVAAYRYQKYRDQLVFRKKAQNWRASEMPVIQVT